MWGCNDVASCLFVLSVLSSDLAGEFGHEIFTKMEDEGEGGQGHI